MRLRGLSSRASASGNGSVAMMNEPMGMIFFRSAGVADEVYPLVAMKTSFAKTRPREVSRRKPGAPFSDARLIFCTRAFSKTRGSGSECGTSQSGNIARRIQSGANLVNDSAEVNVGTDFGAQVLLRNDAKLMIELATDHFDRTSVSVEMRLLAGNLKMAGAREVAIDLLFANNLLHKSDRSQ